MTLERLSSHDAVFENSSVIVSSLDLHGPLNGPVIANEAILSTSLPNQSLKRTWASGEYPPCRLEAASSGLAPSAQIPDAPSAELQR